MVTEFILEFVLVIAALTLVLGLVCLGEYPLDQRLTYTLWEPNSLTKSYQQQQAGF